jgi:hypothetical protein
MRTFGTFCRISCRFKFASRISCHFEAGKGRLKEGPGMESPSPSLPAATLPFHSATLAAGTAAEFKKQELPA